LIEVDMEPILLKQNDDRLGYVQAEGTLGWPLFDCFGQPYERRSVVIRQLPLLGPPARFVVIPPARDSNDLTFVLEVKAQFDKPDKRKAEPEV
jgi:hypothetical protein